VPDAEILRATMAAERRRLVALRADGTIGDDAFHRIGEDLDGAELNTESVLRTEAER
jgi:CPA1 family monovalent cation:H+ antiporter